MKDNYYYYFCLHAYLSRADHHYVEGRFLWANYAVDGSCILLWLAIEQLIKLNIIQERIEKKVLDGVEIKESGNKVTLDYDPQEKDVRKINKILDKTSYKINSRHQLNELLRILNDQVNIDLSIYYDTLGKVKEYYERRYYKDEGTSISIGQLDSIDEVYFLLRGNLNEQFPRALIDEINFQKKFDIEHPLRFWSYAYRGNKYFKSRKHPIVNHLLPDGREINNDGVTDKINKL
jgi:hypothetical protein